MKALKIVLFILIALLVGVVVASKLFNIGFRDLID